MSAALKRLWIYKPCCRIHHHCALWVKFNINLLYFPHFDLLLGCLNNVYYECLKKQDIFCTTYHWSSLMGGKRNGICTKLWVNIIDIKHQNIFLEVDWFVLVDCEVTSQSRLLPFRLFPCPPSRSCPSCPPWMCSIFGMLDSTMT